MISRCLWTVLAAAILIANPSSSVADVIWSEDATGQLSQDPLNPTNLLNPANTPGMDLALPLGISSILGTIERNAQGIYDIDVYRVIVAPGTQITSITVPEYVSADMIAVMGINNDVFFPYNQDPLSPLYFSDQNPPVPLIIGFAAFGLQSGALPFTAGGDAHNLLDINDPLLTDYSKIGSRANAGKPFDGHGPTDKFSTLGPGDYTFYLQQSGNNTGYRLDILVTAIPEPTSFAMVGLAISGLAVLRRKRS